MDLKHIRNFSIIAHIDHGKSTLADRMLEVTGTIEARKMRDQVLDNMELERERGITIKMQPVRMVYHADRRLTQTGSQTNADNSTPNNSTPENSDFLYKDITSKIRGACFAVKKTLGLGHKEIVYQKALEIEFTKIGLHFEGQKIIDIFYEGKKVGTYMPDFVVEGKVLIELKSFPEIGKPQEEQVWNYLKGSSYQLAILINFGNRDIEFKRVVYEIARSGDSQRQSAASLRESAGVSGQVEYQLNLIDTPGHIDFSYEVSRALKAVEGSILLVDSTQGVQAQTLTTLEAARAEGLVIVPAVSKIDSPLARPEEVKLEIASLLGIDPDTILSVSGKTGEGVAELLQAVIERVPPPSPVAASAKEGLKALVFDFKYDDHRGVIVYVRIFEGSVKRHDRLLFSIAGEKFIALEVGIFTPGEEARDSLNAGEIGYIVTGVKQPGIASVGDTITTEKNPLPALPGYANPRPVVWASIYPESQDDFPTLKMALGRLKLSDSAFTFEEESSGALGRGFRAGFLGMLHLEIITERLRREYRLELIVTTPSITYVVKKRNGGQETVYSPHLFPDDGEIISVEEPWADMRIITPARYIGVLMPFLYEHEAEVGETESFGEDRSRVTVAIPLREMMRGFFDELKSLTSGYASITYTIAGLRPASVTRMDIVLADEVVPAFTRVISRRRAQEEADEATEKLQKILPRQQFEMKVQGVALGKILSSKTIKAFRKDVLMHGSKMVGGGDVSRKKKLLEKQKKGKARMRNSGKVNIPHDVFLKMMQRGED